MGRPRDGPYIIGKCQPWTKALSGNLPVFRAFLDMCGLLVSCGAVGVGAAVSSWVFRVRFLSAYLTLEGYDEVTGKHTL
jgi:hypothetical protein